MASRVRFSDVSSAVTSITSTWEMDREMVDAEAQTSEQLYQFAESEMQTGVSTEIVTDEVKAKYEGMTVLDFMSKKHKRMSKERWRAAIEKGKVTVANTVDFEVQTNPESKIAGEYVVEYVNTGADMGVQTMHPREVMHELGNASRFNLDSGNEGAVEGKYRDSKEEGKHSEGKTGDYGEDYEDDYDNEFSNFDRQAQDESKSSGAAEHPVAAFLRNKVALVTDALEENSSSTAFDGYEDALLGGRGRGDDDDKEVTYWQKLSVDLERKRVVYPDWSKGKHHPAKITRAFLTRNKERVYDVEYEDSSTSHAGLREEHIRVVGDALNLGSGAKNNPGKALSEGMKVHAPVKSRGGMKYFPGRVVRVHGKAPNCAYDVEVEGGMVVKEKALSDLIVGVVEGQSVEARRPSVTPLQATGVSWNSSGTSVGVSYGRTDIIGWCNDPGAVCVWNVFSKTFKADNPEYTLDHASCLMCVAFHPTIPSIVAAGSFNGEVLYWDLTKGADQPAIVSPIAEYSHKEPITKLVWVSAGSGGSSNNDKNWLLCSSGADGRVLFWNLETGMLHPVLGGQVTSASSEGSSRSSSSVRHEGYPASYGVTSLGFSGGVGSPLKPQWLVVGQEGGHFLRTQAYRLLSSPRLDKAHFALAKESTSLRFDSNVYAQLRKGEESFAHEAHVGSVNAIDFSPFSRSLFLSCGSDGTVQLMHLLETAPLRSWEPSLVSIGAKQDGGATSKDRLGFTPLSGVQFSPTRPLVFAAASMSGCIFLFDMMKRENGPVAVLEVPREDTADATTQSSDGRSRGKARRGTAESSGPVLSDICFNRKQRGMVAASDLSGDVHIWRLGWSLTTARQGEMHELGRLEQASSAKGP